LLPGEAYAPWLPLSCVLVHFLDKNHSQVVQNQLIFLLVYFKRKCYTLYFLYRTSKFRVEVGFSTSILVKRDKVESSVSLQFLIRMSK